ncbi:hypothetical protein GH714_018664 [Hevea brasiliensis]|uniref:Protein kinase domain-containing protein n=1 Tax=Hevea brasiliensis TaxID=3981 RepID=A0A6A6LTU8_HEVBR|nr:hypothetical protein GH714_018664 [Hevea brasiliensis]
MQIKASLDPLNRFLTSWEPNTDPCAGSFEGVACNEQGRVANISLQGKGLSGEIPPAVGGLKSLTGLYLHFNALIGEIPKEIAELTELSDLYLNVNNLSGEIPFQIGNMSNLQVLQLCYNKLTGSLPTQLGSLKKLNVLALQYNQLTGAIPASLGDLGLLTRLDLSFNGLFGSIPVKLANAPMLQVLDIRNNSLSGDVPPALKRLNSGFQYDNNPKLCGVEFPNLETCDHLNPDRPEPSKPSGALQKDIPESANLPSNCSQIHCSNSSKSPQREVERATQCFSEVNLLGKSNFSATYKGILRDGSIVAVKCITKMSCKSDEADFLKGLKNLTSLKHENLYLDINEGNGRFLEWSARISIIKGIAKGIGYLHGHKGNKSALFHQNISAEKVLIDRRYNPLLSDSGLHKLLADDIVFSMLKASAAMGYLAPEYTTTGRFTEKSDVYAFGMIVLQLLSGKRIVTTMTRQAVESFRVEDFIDANLERKFSESEAAKLGRLALLCTHESPNQRPTMESVLEELHEIIVSP